MMPSFVPLAACATVALLCCASCASREERAQDAFAKLIASIEALSVRLELVDGEQSAKDAAAELEELCDDFLDALAEVDKYGDDPELPQEARRRIGEAHQQGLKLAVAAALRQGARLVARRLYHSSELEKLLRHGSARFNSGGKHPWPRAVLLGREYRPKPPKRK